MQKIRYGRGHRYADTLTLGPFTFRFRERLLPFLKTVHFYPLGHFHFLGPFTFGFWDCPLSHTSRFKPSWTVQFYT